MIGLNTTQLGTLFRLRVRLLWRQFTGEKGRIVNALVAISIFAPVAIGLAIGSAVAYIQLPPPWPGQFLGGVLVLLWLIWGLTPVVLGAINSSIDVARLLVYPIRRRDLAVSILGGTLLDYPTFLIIPLFAAVVVGWIWTPGWPFVIVGLPIAYFHMVIIGQIVMVGLGNILQSRRFRDLSLIVFSVMGASCYFLSQGIRRIFVEFVDPEAAAGFLAAWRPLDQLQWLPPGAVARAIERGAVGETGAAVIWLLYATVSLLGLGWIWMTLLDRLMAGYGFVWGSGRADRPAGRRKNSRGRPQLAFVAEPLRSILIKEWVLMLRIPQRRIGLIQAFLLPLIFTGIFLFGGEIENARLFGGDNRRLALTLIGYGYLAVLGFGGNTFSWEGQGLAMLFLTPADRQTIMWGKTVISMVLAAAPVVLYTPLLALATPFVPLLAAFLIAIGLMGAGTAVAMLFSVWFPFPVNTDPKKPFARPERRGGFIPTVMTVLVAPLLTGLLGSPLLVPLILIWGFERDGIGLVLSFLAAGYGLGLAWWSTRLSGDQLIKREPEILGALVVPDGD